MSWVIIGLAATTMLVLGLVLSFVLGWANRAFHVEVDPRVDAVIDALPGANCGGCGYVGCGEYAEAVVLDDEAVNLCTVGGKSCAEALAAVMGVAVAVSYPWRPVVQRRSSQSARWVVWAAGPVSGHRACLPW